MEAAPRPLPLGIVVARVLIVSGLGFAAAAAIFLVIAAAWLPALAAFALTAVFVVLMFVIERGAAG